MYLQPIIPATKTKYNSPHWGSKTHKATESLEGSWNQRRSHQQPSYKTKSLHVFFRENTWIIKGKYMYLNVNNSGVSIANLHEEFTYTIYIWKMTVQKFLQDLNLS